MRKKTARVTNTEGFAIEYLPPYPDGLCKALPSEVYIKYFQANGNTFEVRTAKAMCAQCPVRELCLEQAINAGPVKRRGGFVRTGVIGGMTVNQIYRIQAWEAYDRGLRPNPPVDSRVKPEEYINPGAPRPATAIRIRKAPKAPKAPEVPKEPQRVTVADLSFEERVYLIFREVKEGKFQTLNDAVREIAALHNADILSQDGKLGSSRDSLLNYDMRRLVKRPSTKSQVRTF